MDQWYFGPRAPRGSTPRQHHDLAVAELKRLLPLYQRIGEEDHVHKSRRIMYESQIDDPEHEDYDHASGYYSDIVKEFRDVEDGQERNDLLDQFTAIYRDVTGNVHVVPEVEPYVVPEDPPLYVPSPRYRRFNDMSDLRRDYKGEHPSFPDHKSDYAQVMQSKLRRARALIMEVFRDIKDSETEITDDERTLLNAELFCLLD